MGLVLKLRSCVGFCTSDEDCRSVLVGLNVAGMMAVGDVFWKEGRRGVESSVVRKLENMRLELGCATRCGTLALTSGRDAEVADVKERVVKGSLLRFCEAVLVWTGRKRVQRHERQIMLGIKIRYTNSNGCCDA